MVVKVDRPNTCCVSFDICEANQGGALAQVKVELTEVKEEYTAEEWAQWYADWADWAWYEEDDGQQQAAEPVEPEPEYVDVVTSETEDEAYEPPKGPVKAKQRPTPPPAPPAKHAQVFMAPPPKQTPGRSLRIPTAASSTSRTAGAQPRSLDAA